MMKFHQVKLELVRPGPPHNQLLSPLTPYMALCGEGSPITFHIGIEHRQMLSRLERLRYVTTDSRSGVAVPNRIREATVAEIGENVARILGQIRTLLGEEWRARCGANVEASGMLHLRLVLTGSELSLIPFEMALAPQAFPGEGMEWALQFHLPVVPTREIRRSRLAPVSWDRRIEPRILLVSAAPMGLEVPLSAHVQALRSALEPWIRWPKRKDVEESSNKEEDVDKQRLRFVKERLRILPDATIEQIYETCSKEQFTHVHILAHGDHVDIGGETRYGIALCAKDNRNRKVVVNGRRLAKALQAESEDGTRRSCPLWVTLATCDSGNEGSILVPGGSIAHELHTAGIPWVFASQFPLTKAGSIRMAKTLYPRLLRGDDPRMVLYEVRRKLFMLAERDHDWASLVAYSAGSKEFEDEVMTFFERQMRRAITICLDRAENAENDDETDIALQKSRGWLELWRGRLPDGDGNKERGRRAECYGMHGSTWKRIGLLHLLKNQETEGGNALEESLGWYRKAMAQRAMNEDRYHWVATQALSLVAVLEQPPEPEPFTIARYFARSELSVAEDSRKAWAHGSMAELEMIATYHAPDQVAANVEEIVVEHCRAIVDLAGAGSFEVHSTRQQFKRYVDYWDKEEWRSIAEKAVEALSPKKSGDRPELPLY